MAIDGFVLDIPDTKENDTAFGRSGSEKNPAPFPQVRVVGLGECGTHAIVAARLAAWRTSERALAGELLADFGPGMLIIADRGFYSWQLWQAAAASGADLLWRMQDGPKLPVVRAFPDGSYESFLLDPKVRGRRATQRHRGSANIEEPSGIPVRVIEYEVTNREGKGEIFCLITTIMDPEDASAAELAAAYQERWEFESSLDEIKTHQRWPSRRAALEITRDDQAGDMGFPAYALRDPASHVRSGRSRPARRVIRNSPVAIFYGSPFNCY